MREQAAVKYATFGEFYPFYLSEHANRTCRRLHFVGTTLGLALFVTALASANAWWLAGGLVCGYAFAWVGHYFSSTTAPPPSAPLLQLRWRLGDVEGHPEREDQVLIPEDASVIRATRELPSADAN